MSTPLSYLDLVIKTVKGESPIAELMEKKVDRLPLAKEFIQELKKKYPGETSGHLIRDMMMNADPSFLASMWEKMGPQALTMCGDKNINALLLAMQTITQENIPGDFIETGVWRGGLPLIMRAYLHSVADKTRTVWLADSFQGLPSELSDENDQVAHELLSPIKHLAANRENVEKAFDYFGLNDTQVKFLEGWFCDTLPTIPKETKFSLARLDGDYYESTRDALENLYPKLTPGGFLIVDDYNLPLGCMRAVDEYREKNHITSPMVEINSQSIYWRK